MLVRYTEAVRTAYIALSANKVRSFLTMLGVIIGVFSVVTLISLGQGIQNYITDEFDALGSNLLFITPGRFDFQGDPGAQLTANKLEQKHIELIEDFASEYVVGVSPLYQVGENVDFKTNRYFSEILGVSYDATDIFNYEVEEGREFTRAEQRNSAKVAIIGPQIEKELFGALDPLGNRIKIAGESYEVIGIFKEKGANYDDQIIVPYTTAEETFNLENYSSITAKINDADKVNLAAKAIEIAMLRDLEEDEFSVVSQDDILGSIQQILQVLTLGLGAIAAISLVVGGIGIMNIMLVSVTERTKEVGLRKAVGATPTDIGIQFLIESMMLSLAGGFVGLFFGFVVTIVGQQFLRMEIPAYAVVLAFGFAAIVGAVFGTYPAVSASKKDPIESLRYE